MSLNPYITADSLGVLTLHWTADPLAEGYRIVTPTGASTAGKTKTSAKLGAHTAISVSVAPLYAQTAETAVYPAATPPPPPVVLPVELDGGFEDGTLGPWKVEANNHGAKQTAHATFGDWFIDKPLGPGKHGARSDLPADTTRFTRCEVLTPQYPLTVGEDKFWSLRYDLNASVDFGTSWLDVVIAQLGWQGYAPPVLGLVAHNDRVVFTMKSGKTDSVTKHGEFVSYAGAPASAAGVTRLPDLYMIPPNLFQRGIVELIVRRLAATDSSGIVEGWFRLKGDKTWTQTFSLSGYPTVQTMTDGTTDPAYDIVTCYRGPSTAPVRVKVGGYSRCDTFAEAAGMLP